MVNRYERLTLDSKEDMIVLSRTREGQFVLTHTATGVQVETDERAASKLILLDSFKETGKCKQLASRIMGHDASGFRLDSVLQAEVEATDLEDKRKAIDSLTEHLNSSGRKEKDEINPLEDGREVMKPDTLIDGKQPGVAEGKKDVLDAHVTGIGAAGDFHLSARVRDERTGEIRNVKGMITGLDAALLRSDTNEQGKDGTVLRNAQALASENFEKGMAVAFSRNNSVTIKME